MTGGRSVVPALNFEFLVKCSKFFKYRVKVKCNYKHYAVRTLCDNGMFVNCVLFDKHDGGHLFNTKRGYTPTRHRIGKSRVCRVNDEFAGVCTVSMRGVDARCRCAVRGAWCMVGYMVLTDLAAHQEEERE